MIMQSTYQAMKEMYGTLGSWAIWADESDRAKSNVGDLSAFDDPSIIKSLRSDIVFVGLNISRDLIKLPWGNFHDSSPASQDYKIRHALNNTPWWGAYMTDIIKSHSDVDSSNVIKHLKNHPEYEIKNINDFQEELNILNVENLKIAAFGHGAYEILSRNSRVLGIDFKLVKLPHYAMRINKDIYRDRVIAELKKLGD